MKIIFYSHANKTHFHMKGFALSLVLKVRVFGTRKWSIYIRRNLILAGVHQIDGLLILVTRSLALVVMSMSLFCEYKSRVISRIIFVFVYLLFDFTRFYTEIKKGKRNVNSLVPVKNFRHFKTLNTFAEVSESQN